MTHADAQRAIYIDLEQPQGSARNPSRPAIIGVLLGATGENFKQLLVDDRLASAAVASPRCSAVDRRTEAAHLLDKARAEDRAIIGWSNFDRDRLIDILPDRSAEIDDRYINPLSTARQWARLLHPHAPIVRAAPKSPRHTLDQYARLAGYSDANRLQGTPAQWINDTLDRLAKANGRYRALSKSGKRDWHRLLEYNRHDCLALRHIVLTATRELDCWHAYERTRFCVNDNGREVCFVARSKSRKLEALLHRHCATCWAFITAWNPASEPLSRGENDKHQRNLVQEVESRRYRWLSGEGRGQDPAWTPEESLLILGISEAKAVAVGRKFGQLAIVVGERGKPSRLVSTAPIHASPSRRSVAGR